MDAERESHQQKDAEQVVSAPALSVEYIRAKVQALDNSIASTAAKRDETGKRVDDLKQQIQELRAKVEDRNRRQQSAESELKALTERLLISQESVALSTEQPTVPPGGAAHDAVPRLELERREFQEIGFVFCLEEMRWYPATFKRRKRDKKVWVTASWESANDYMCQLDRPLISPQFFFGDEAPQGNPIDLYVWFDGLHSRDGAWWAAKILSRDDSNVKVLFLGDGKTMKVDLTGSYRIHWVTADSPSYPAD